MRHFGQVWHRVSRTEDAKYSRCSGAESIFRIFAAALLFLALCFHADAAEHITLKNGFDLICDHRQTDGDHVRLYLDSGSANFVDIAVNEIVSSEYVDLPKSPANTTPATANTKLTTADLHELLTRAGTRHDLDVDLLASIVNTESGGNAHAVSHSGARGLMQLMPKTAADLGVNDSFAADQNVNGGTAYLDALLKKYHDNLALALAAYNAGPAAVERWHGIPPYRETRAYVARVIHEFNRRYSQRISAQKQLASMQGSSGN
jgi:soluble lytic murein transglycosylase-like protein